MALAVFINAFCLFLLGPVTDSIGQAGRQVGSHDLPSLPAPPWHAHGSRNAFGFDWGIVCWKFSRFDFRAQSPPCLVNITCIIFRLFVFSGNDIVHWDGQGVAGRGCRRGCKNAEKARSSLLERQTEPWPWHFTTLSGTLLSFHFVSFRFSISL